MLTTNMQHFDKEKEIPEEQKYETSLDSDDEKPNHGPTDSQHQITGGQYTAPSSKYRKDGEDMVATDDERHYELVQITNDIYNRIQYLELSTFFFAYSGLFMAMLEYEMRYYLINGEYREGQTPNHTEPLGITPDK